MEDEMVQFHRTGLDLVFGTKRVAEAEHDVCLRGAILQNRRRSIFDDLGDRQHQRRRKSPSLDEPPREYRDHLAEWCSRCDVRTCRLLALLEGLTKVTDHLHQLGLGHVRPSMAAQQLARAVI